MDKPEDAQCMALTFVPTSSHIVNHTVTACPKRKTLPPLAPPQSAKSWKQPAAARPPQPKTCTQLQFSNSTTSSASCSNAVALLDESTVHPEVASTLKHNTSTPTTTASQLEQPSAVPPPHVPSTSPTRAADRKQVKLFSETIVAPVRPRKRSVQHVICTDWDCPCRHYCQALTPIDRVSGLPLPEPVFVTHGPLSGSSSLRGAGSKRIRLLMGKSEALVSNRQRAKKSNSRPCPTNRGTPNTELALASHVHGTRRAGSGMCDDMQNDAMTTHVHGTRRSYNHSQEQSNSELPELRTKFDDANNLLLERGHSGARGARNGSPTARLSGGQNTTCKLCKNKIGAPVHGVSECCVCIELRASLKGAGHTLVDLRSAIKQGFVRRYMPTDGLKLVLSSMIQQHR